MSTAPAFPVTDATATTTTGSAAPATQPRCPVCDHDLESHDSVSRRYCAATQARALSRNCICR